MPERAADYGAHAAKEGRLEIAMRKKKQRGNEGNYE